MNEVYLLTGGNQGDRHGYLQRALAALDAGVGAVVRTSPLYETAAWGLEDQAPFLNQVLILHTSLEAPAVLQKILSIEENLGRRRTVKYGPRTIDIDMLFFNDDIITTPTLTVPHPHIAARRFVLEPMNELAPDKLHPVLKKTIAQLLAACADTLPVHKIS